MTLSRPHPHHGLVVLLSLGLFTYGCGGKPPAAAGDAYDNAPTGAKASKAGAVSPGSLALTVSSELAANLQRKAGLTSDQAKTLSQAGVAKIGDKKASLMLTDGTGAASDYENNITSFAADMVAGAIANLSDPSVGISDKAALNKVLATVLKSTLGSCEGRTGGVTVASFAQVLQSINTAAVRALKDGGVDASSTADAVQTLINAAVGALGDTGMLTTDAAGTLVAASVAGAVSGLKSTAVSDISAFGDVFTKLMTGADTALTRAGLTAPQSADVTKQLVNGAIATMGSAGFAATDVVSLLDNAIQGVMNAFTTIGVTDTILIKAINAMTDGAVDAFDAAGLSKSNYSAAMAAVVDTAISSMKVLNVDTTELSNAALGVAKTAVAGLANAGLTTTDTDVYAQTIEIILVGVLTNLDDAGLSKDAVQGLVKDVITATFTPLAKAGFAKTDRESLATAITKNLGTDLAAKGVNIDASTLSADVTSAADAGG